jgi:hypothetical protein
MVRAISAAIVLSLLASGCVRGTARAPAPVPTETPRPTPAPVAKAPATTKGKTAPPVTTAPAPQAQVVPKKAPASTSQPPKQPAAPGAAAATLDLDALKTELKQTKAIGVFTKLTLKNQVDDLLDKFRAHHAGKPTPTVSELRRSYDLLMMKVLSLLQDHDQRLASEIVSSRETIWGLLVDPKKFAALQA